jgi:hypothetical protein
MSGIRRNAMKKTASAVVLLFLGAVLAGCGNERYSDVKAVSNDLAQALENCAAALDNAAALENAAALGNAAAADDVASAFDQLAAEVENIAPRMAAIDEKYPELRGLDKLPVELQEVQARFDNVAPRLSEAVMRANMRYRMDPKVRDANDRMEAAMTMLPD